MSRCGSRPLTIAWTRRQRFRQLDLAASRPRSAEELRTTLDTAAGETDRLITLAGDLLVLARQRPTPPRRALTDVPSLLAEAVAPLRADAARAAANIHIHAPDSTVDIDPAQTGRAVRNLVENSIRHGRGDITIIAQVSARRLQIDVHDHGLGFPERLLPTVFEPFTYGPGRRPDDGREAGTTTTPTTDPHGAGLGLAIVRAIAEAHHGTATATNAPDGGAHVRLHLTTSRPDHD